MVWGRSTETKQGLQAIVDKAVAALEAGVFTELDEAIGRLQPEHIPPCSWILTNARDYADIRRWGRDVIDIETGGERFPGDVACYFKDAGVLVRSRQIPVGSVVLVTPRGISRVRIRRDP